MNSFYETICAIWEALKYAFTLGREMVSVFTSSSLLMVLVVLSVLGMAVRKMR